MMQNLETIINQLESFEVNAIDLQELDKPEGELAQRFWQALVSNQHLTRLHLQGWGLSEAEVKLLAEFIANNSVLRELHLDRNQLDDAALALLAPALANSYLDTLSLNSNQITASGVGTLTDALITHGKGTLKVLLLGNNRLEDAGLTPLLLALVQRTTLQTLSLSKNDLTAQGAKALAQWLQQTGGLPQLFLAANPIGDAGVQVLAPALPAAHLLEWLVLDGVGLGDHGLAALSEALPRTQNLKRCGLANNPDITESALDDLEQRLAPRKTLQRAYQQWLQGYYLERAILQYDQGQYRHAITRLKKVLRLKRGQSVALFYHDRAVLADMQERLSHYQAVLTDPLNAAGKQEIQKLIPVLQTMENTFKQAWQADLLPSERLALTQQGRSCQLIWQILAELLQNPDLSPWNFALRQNKEMTLQQLLNQGYEINCPLNTQRITALHYAAQQGNTQQVQWLLDHGARADVKDKQCQFPVDYVPAENKVLTTLLREAHYQQMCQAEVKTLQLLTRLTDDTALTAKEWQLLKKKIQEIQENLTKLDQLYTRCCRHFPEEKTRLDALYQQYRDAYEPLWSDPSRLPACHQYPETRPQAQEDALLQKMMDLNPAAGKQVTTTELLGCYNELTKIVTDLRLLKAVPEMAYQQLQTHAITAEWWIIDSPLGVPAIDVQAAFEAAETGNQTQLFKRLIRYPRLCYARSSQGQTLLHAATEAGQSGLLGWLLKEYALLVTWVDQQGETALHLAARIGQADCLTVLLTAGSDVFHRNTAGFTAWELALMSSQSNLAAVDVFIRVVGHQLRDANADSNTWLDHLNMGQHPQKSVLLERIHQAGLADPANGQGSTSLHLAVEQGTETEMDSLIPYPKSGLTPVSKSLGMAKGEFRPSTTVQSASESESPSFSIPMAPFNNKR
jgi:ankyrin repeat protein